MHNTTCKPGVPAAAAAAAVCVPETADVRVSVDYT